MDVNSASDPSRPVVSPQVARQRDSGAVAAPDLPHRLFPSATGVREPRFQVIYSQTALDDIHKHGKSSLQVEVCGVLVGNVYRDDTGPLLHVESIIEGNNASGHAAQVTFTAETWTHIQDVMEKRHPNQRIVGWYHTHPGFGIFLSGMDLFIHENFFALPWQVAFVYDPVGGDEGSFVWKLGVAEREAFLVDPTPVNKPRVSKLFASRAGPLTPSGDMAMMAALAARVDTLERRVRALRAGVVFVLLLLIGWITLTYVLPLALERLK